MTRRFRDPRVQSAYERGEASGLSPDLAQGLGGLTQYLLDCRIWSDLTLVLEVVPCGPGRWRVPLGEGWWVVLSWDAQWGAVELELRREGG